MAQHEVTFPITDPAEILKLRAGDEVNVRAFSSNVSQARFESFGGGLVSVDAATGELREPLTREEAEMVARWNYAGDAAMLDYIYAQEEGWPVPEASEIGQRLFSWITRTPACEAVRARRGEVGPGEQDGRRISNLPAPGRRADLIVDFTNVPAGDFVLGNVAAAIGWWKVLAGRELTKWETVARVYDQQISSTGRPSLTASSAE